MMSEIPPRYKEILSTVQAGDYNTRYLLCKYYPQGTVSSFIAHGLRHGYLKKEWTSIGSKRKAILKPAVPSESLLNKDETIAKITA